MRRLILLRHAKSSWGTPGLADIDRGLNDRGKRDAPLMAQQLLSRGLQPDYIICSTARRTRATLTEFVTVLGTPPNTVHFRDDLYLATVSTAQNIIASVPDTARALLLVGHNPTCTDLANLHGDLSIDNVPTCGCVSIDLDITDWSEISSARGMTVGFDYPKKLRR